MYSCVCVCVRARVRACFFVFHRKHTLMCTHREGLLLFTNNGPLSDRLTDPASCVWKEYLAWVRGKPLEETLVRMCLHLHERRWYACACTCMHLFRLLRMLP